MDRCCFTCQHLYIELSSHNRDVCLPDNTGIARHEFPYDDLEEWARQFDEVCPDWEQKGKWYYDTHNPA